MAKRNLILSLVCVVLSGMLTYAYGQNKRDAGQKYLTRPLPQAWEADTLFLQQQPIEGKWWAELQDSQLDSIIGLALQNNQDLLAAADRIRAAHATLRIQQGYYYPNLNFSAGWTKLQNSRQMNKEFIDSPTMNQRYASGELSTSWELDVFGSIRSRVKSSKEQFRATQEEYNAVLVSLTAEVATAYAELRTLQQELLVAQKNMASQQAILHITEVRYNTGLASQLDVSQAKSVYYSTKASIPSIEAGIRQQINALAVLSGLYPSDLYTALKDPRPIPDYMKIVSIGIPVNLLRQRPDIRSAERSVAAAAASVGAAKSDYFPKFYLKGSIGFAARDMDKFFDHNSLTYQIAPTLSWTLFQGRQLTQATKEAKAVLDENIRQYNQTVLGAVQEVDNAMSSYTNAVKQVVALRELVVQGEVTLKLSLDLYKRGLATFQNVLDAQRSLLSYQNSLVSAQGGTLSSLIELYRAVGGGWQIDQNKNE